MRKLLPSLSLLASGGKGLEWGNDSLRDTQHVRVWQGQRPKLPNDLLCLLLPTSQLPASSSYGSDLPKQPLRGPPAAGISHQPFRSQQSYGLHPT